MVPVVHLQNLGIVAQTSSSGGSMGGILSNPWFYAILSALSLAIGGILGAWIDPSKKWQALVLAAGGGSLLVALTFELYEPATKAIGVGSASGFFLLGVVVFGGLDLFLDHEFDSQSEERGWGLWGSITTDGIPENAALGSILVGGVHGALALLFALVLTNGSQSMMSASNMRANRGEWQTIGAWIVTGVIIGAAVLVGYQFLPGVADYWISALRAFASGAILSGIAGEIFPDAYDDAGPDVTLATAVGFLITFLL